MSGHKEILERARDRIRKSTNLENELPLIFDELVMSMTALAQEQDEKIAEEGETIGTLEIEKKQLQDRIGYLDERVEILSCLLFNLPDALRLVAEVPDIELRGRLDRVADHLHRVVEMPLVTKTPISLAAMLSN